MLRPGTLLGNRYLLGEPVAAGGMGEVWQATDPVLQRTVAVKVLLPSLLSDAEFIGRFRAEARMMAGLRHPGIVQVHDYGADAVVDDVRRDFLVMEYVEGTSLGARIAATGVLSVGETLAVVAQAAEALDVAHRAGIVHRDVKPNNLLVRPDGSVVLVDFGVARSVDDTGITNANMIVGSPQYMAPEQVTGQPVTVATDIHALGAVAFCCLTGRSPFAADNAVQVIGRLLHGGPPAFPVRVPEAVAQLVLRALDPDPAGRFPSAAAFAEAARALAAAPPAPMPPPASPSPVELAADPLVVAPPIAPTPPVVATRQSAAGPRVAGPRAANPVALAGPTRRRYRTVAVVGAAVAVVLGVTAVAGAVVLRPDTTQAGTTTSSTDRLGAAALDAGPGAPASTPVPAGPATPTSGADPTGADPTGLPPAPPTSSGPGVPTDTPREPAETESPAPRDPAAPATNPYSAAQVCGDGFAVVDSASLKKANGTVVGTVYLLYHSATGRNCALMMKRTAIGSKTTAAAYLQVQGKTRVTDTGSFAYYAGPVRAAAAATCVKWGGSTAGVQYDSPYEHCG